ncbi:helix-turn-helix domain-containing protein [Limimaricola cinnabarinus]|uniref:HTH cro/C1-type domain-containing protein n=2 Tax=Limimaricola TaxID=2211638 RepID=A0A2G1MBY5_9RHOB|nr:helix-turn-helix transcriptional regulator [Limimaricola cinnabarinus]PHP26245.1 hypothetical protein CJ301_17380 [Limimaricola cinnabarinus]
MPESYHSRPQPVRYPTELGQALRTVRKAKGMTQAELGALSGIRAHHISMIETGTTKPTASTIFELLAALDLDCVLTQRGHPLGGPPLSIEGIFTEDDDDFPTSFRKARGTVDPDIDL